jgi:hypothetical protein
MSKRIIKKQLDRTDAEIERNVDKICKAGGRILEVHAYKGRFHIKHRVLIDKKGRIFFPEHNMCSCHAMVAEWHMKKISAFDDVCYALALALTTKSFQVFPLRNRRRYTKDDMTVEQKQWMSLEAFQFVGEVTHLWTQRSLAAFPSQDPSVRGISFQVSARKRMDAVINTRTKRAQDKLARVETALRAKGHSQLGWNAF